jgi:prevent-host-death family protein
LRATASLASIYVHLYIEGGTGSMAGRRYSVAEARHSFARLIRAAERGRPVEITRRGEPVVVLVSASQYLALTRERPSFVDSVAAIRVRLDVDHLRIGDEEFARLRDESAGREVSL